jgi:hypothetical protein
MVICDLPPAAWRANGKPNADGITLLRFALDCLADHYRKPPDDIDAVSPADVDHIDAVQLRRRMIELNP